MKALQAEPARLEEFRRGFGGVVGQDIMDNAVRQDCLVTRATKVGA